MSNKLAFPTVHLNGTSPLSLQEGLLNAAQALRAAIQAVSDAAPHGRDYYPQGDMAFVKAREEHGIRLERLDRTLREIYEINENVCWQMASRSPR